MADVRLSVIYYSATSSVYALAQQAVEAGEKAGAEVRLRKVRELAPQEAIDANEGWSKHVLETQDVLEASADDVTWADAVMFGSPTRFGNVAAQLKQFFDTLGAQWGQGQLADKVYTGFTSTGTNHGGQESTLLAMYNSFYHFGGIIVPPGYTDASKFVDGNPYGASHISQNGANPPQEVDLTSVAYSATRAVEIAGRIKRGTV